MHQRLKYYDSIKICSKNDQWGEGRKKKRGNWRKYDMKFIYAFHEISSMQNHWKTNVSAIPIQVFIQTRWHNRRQFDTLIICNQKEISKYLKLSPISQLRERTVQILHPYRKIFDLQYPQHEILIEYDLGLKKRCRLECQSLTLSQN